jgi:hypothetical protein
VYACVGGGCMCSNVCEFSLNVCSCVWMWVCVRECARACVFCVSVSVCVFVYTFSLHTSQDKNSSIAGVRKYQCCGIGNTHNVTATYMIKMVITKYQYTDYGSMTDVYHIIV